MQTLQDDLALISASRELPYKKITQMQKDKRRTFFTALFVNVKS